MKLNNTIVVALLSFFVMGQSANASLVTLTDLGSAFTLSYESTSTGLFGAPSLSNSTISFNPSTFVAESTGPNITDITNSTFVMSLKIKDGYQFSSISLVERGDYLLNNDNFALVNVTGQIRVHDNANVVASEATSPINETSGPYINDFDSHNWEATANINQSDGSWYQGEELTLTLENILIAQAQDFPDFAFIEKKLVAIEITAVPLPTASLLLIFGLLSLLPAVRKK